MFVQHLWVVSAPESRTHAGKAQGSGPVWEGGESLSNPVIYHLRQHLAPRTHCLLEAGRREALRGGGGQERMKGVRREGWM